MRGASAGVELASGRVHGRDGAFLGIPHAAPPVGPRRWAPPAPVEPWAGELAATTLGPPPPQQPQRPVSAPATFQEHHEESKNVNWSHPVLPWIVFFQNVDAIIGLEDEIVYPPNGLTNEMDYELELAVVIGKPGKFFTPEQAGEYIAGQARRRRRVRDREGRRAAQQGRSRAGSRRRLMPAEALALRWDEQEFTEVRPGIFGATIDSEQLTVTVYRYEPGCAWETHAHLEDQVTFIAEGGTVNFVVDGRPTPLSAGQLAVIPGGVPHSASIPPAGERVVTVNVWRLRKRG